MLHICVFAWGDKYSKEYVARLVAGVRRHLKESHRFLLLTDSTFQPAGTERTPIPDMELTKIPGCFSRLRLFDPQWQESVGISPGDRIVCVDLDSIVTKPLDPLFCRPENFLILTGANAINPCPYNGSLWMLRAGYRPDVWSDFSLEAASKIPFYAFPDDQAWFAHKLPGVIGWKAGSASGVYAFQKPGWPKDTTALPADARLVVFPGWRDPSKFTHLDWVRDRWAA
jgi:hypothetical protein